MFWSVEGGVLLCRLVFDITRAQSFTQDTLVTVSCCQGDSLLSGKIGLNAIRWHVGGGGLKRCIVGYIEGVISEHLEALSIPHRSLWSRAATNDYFYFD